MTENDIKFMRLAITEAKKAFSKEEVPIGAVLTGNNDKLISRGYNRTETDLNSCAHAEIITIIKASKKLKSWRLSGCTIYVTLEPCIMCLGAIINSRIGKIVYGASDPKCGSTRLVNTKTIHSNLEILQSDTHIQIECSDLISNFFKKLRSGKAI